MSIAVGMVETLGFPAVVEAADSMVKASPCHFSRIRENWDRSGYCNRKR